MARMPAWLSLPGRARAPHDVPMTLTLRSPAFEPETPVPARFVHWVLYDLDPARQGVAEGEVPAEATAGANGFGQPGYLGPAPPPGDDPHHYVFRLLAVDEPVSLTGLPSYQDVETAVTGHILGEARLIGTYQR